MPRKKTTKTTETENSPPIQEEANKEVAAPAAAEVAPPPVPVPEVTTGEGVLELGAKGFGSLRQPQHNYLPPPSDVFVSPDLVTQFGLRAGLHIKGETRPPQGG